LVVIEKQDFQIGQVREPGRYLSRQLIVAEIHTHHPIPAHRHAIPLGHGRLQPAIVVVPVVPVGTFVEGHQRKGVLFVYGLGGRGGVALNPRLDLLPALPPALAPLGFALLAPLLHALLAGAVQGVLLLRLRTSRKSEQTRQHESTDKQHLAALEATGGCANADSEQSGGDCEKPVPPEQTCNHG